MNGTFKEAFHKTINREICTVLGGCPANAGEGGPMRRWFCIVHLAM